MVVSHDMKSWWILQQNSSLCVQPYFWTSVSSSYAQYFHPPCTGTEQSRRGPASISMMRHPSYDSSGPRFVLHLDKKRQHAGDSAVDVVTAETEETSVFLPFYTRTAPGCWRARWCCVACPLLRALSQSGECLGRRGHSPPPHWSPQGKQTVPRTLVSRPHNWSLLLHMFTTLVISHKRFPTEIRYYTELEN